MKALVIEDDPNIAMLFKSWLEGCGYIVTVADSYKDAERCIADVPDLRIITLDLNLTDSTYENTIAKIRTMRTHNPDALLVVISGVITHEDASLVTSMGADAMFEKHEVATEKSFLGKLRDMVSSLIKTPTGFQNRAKVLQGVADKVIRRCNAAGCNMAESLFNLDPGSTEPQNEPDKEHIPKPTP